MAPSKSVVILAYSGGLDTSVAIRWLQETYGMDVITLTADIGNERDISAVAARARQIGASEALTVDAREESWSISSGRRWPPMPL